GAPHGHQRRHDDLVHVPARRPDGRRGGPDFGALPARRLIVRRLHRPPLSHTDVWFFAAFTAGLLSFTAAVMGGIGNLKGAVLGGLIIGVIQQISDNRIGPEGTAAVVFAYLILIMVFRPQGLLGEETREAGVERP